MKRFRSIINYANEGLAPKSFFSFFVFTFKIELWIVLRFKR